MLKRYLIAFAGLLAAGIVARRGTEILSWFILSLADLESNLGFWSNYTLASSYAVVVAQSFTAFLVGAYLVRGNPIGFGLVSFGVLALWNVYVFKASSPDRTGSVMEFLSSNTSSLVATVLSAAVGLGVGFVLWRRREAREDAL